MKKTLITLITLATLANADFTRSGDIVTDNQTHLQWQDEPYTAEEATAYSDSTENGKVLYWTSAIAYCEGFSYGEQDDWRLPNFNELYSIADRSRFEPAIDSIFVNVVSSGYWSATTNASNTSYAWIVDFSNGYDVYNDKSYSYYVRCVRGGQ